MSIGVNIGGEPGKITAAVVHESIGDLLTLVSDASRMAGSGDQEWTVSTLEIGSAVFGINAPNESPTTVLLRAGLDRLRSAAEVPEGWTRRMVIAIRDLGRRPGTGGATSISLAVGSMDTTVSIDSVIVDHATRALGVETVSYGSFRGDIDRWNEHGSGKRELGMMRDHGGSITVKYPRGLADRVLSEAIGRRIEAWGRVYRNPSGAIIRLEMEDFEVVGDAPVPIPSATMQGVFVVDGRPMIDLDEWLDTRGD